MQPERIATVSALVLASLAAPTPALACLSCGCGGSGASADLGAVGGAASMFSLGSHWLIQAGTSYRTITGSFNERGDWNPTPVGGSLVTMLTTLGLSYFPTMGSSVSLQLPLVANALNGATWGPLGSINPTDTGPAHGAGVGDMSLQGSYKFLEGDWWALAGWGGASLPSGQATGDPAGFSGAGVLSGEAGLMALAQWGNWEASGNLGYQVPFGAPPLTASTFYVGQAVLYQLQANYKLTDALRLGLGLNGYQGNGRFGVEALGVPTGKLKLVPSAQYAWNLTQGVRLALGHDLGGGRDSLTDTTAYAVFYQYMP